jgi:hypothetical protein
LRVGHRADAGTQIFWENGDGWVAHLTSLDLDDRPMLQRSFGWIDRHFRTSLAKSWESGLRIEMFDAGTGALRAVLPRVGRPWRTFSNDGRWIASAGDAVEVWSVPPPRQTLWATCAGLATLGIALAVGQRRSRSGSNTSGQFPTLSA